VNTTISHNRDGLHLICEEIFSERQHICCSAIACPSVRQSVYLSIRPKHGWISQRRLKLGPCNFHRRVAPWLIFIQ